MAGVAAGVAAGAVVAAAIGVGLLGDPSNNTTQVAGPAPTRTRRNPGTTSQQPTMTPTVGTTPVALPPGTPAPKPPIFSLRQTSEQWPFSPTMSASTSSPPGTTLTGSPTTSTTVPSDSSEPPPTTIAPPQCLLGMVSIQPCPVQ